MKKIVLTIFALSLVFSSCEFDKGFEEMNVNPAKASQIDVGNNLHQLFCEHQVVDTKTGEPV